MRAPHHSALRITAVFGLLTTIGVLNFAGAASALPFQRPGWLIPRRNVSPQNELPPPPAPTSTGTTAPTSNTSSPSSSTVAATSATSGEAGFQCQWIQGQYTVTYVPRSQPSLAYPWAVPQLMGDGWTPEKRCVEISRRLESYRPDGMIELQTGQENGYNTVCVTTQNAPGCRIVFTVPNGQDPVTTRDLVFQNIAYAEQGQQTQAVNTFVNQGNGSLVNDLNQLGKSVFGSTPTPTARTTSGGIDLRPFLDQADGGTGAKLQSGSTP